MPAPTASDLTPTPANGDPMDMLNHLRTESSSPLDLGGASVSVAAEERATNRNIVKCIVLLRGHTYPEWGDFHLPTSYIFLGCLPSFLQLSSHVGYL